jgi:hypothetical protein
MNPMMMMMMMMLVLGGGVCMCSVLLLFMGGSGEDTLGTDPGTGEAPAEVTENVQNVTEYTPDGCVTLTEHADGSGTQKMYCLDGRDYFEIKNFKNYGFNDKASGIGVGRGVGTTIFADANQGGASHEIHGPVFQNLADVWKNDVVSSMKMWKR